MSLANRWQLPDGIEELLPERAAMAERLRRSTLDLFQCWGYQLVIPPLVEFADSLLVGLGQDLDLQTFKMIDQLNGRMLAIRADITPQVARMDSHSLQSNGVNRLCYEGSVVHTQQSTLKASRAPIQVGAELYGEDSVSADVEVVSLMLESLLALGVKDITLDLGHVGIYRELIAEAGLDAAAEVTLFAMLQEKSLTDLSAWLTTAGVDAELAQSVRALAHMSGGIDVLARARTLLPQSAGIAQAIQKLEVVAEHITRRYPSVDLYFDLSELRGFNYHTGLVFAAFVPGVGRAIALGGRYDGIGSVFGCARPATGFNADLKALLDLVPKDESVLNQPISAPDDLDPELWVLVAQLRSDGETVITDFSAETTLKTTRYLQKNKDGQWVLLEQGK